MNSTALLATLLLLVGCSMGPDYQRAEHTPTMPKTFAEAKEDAATNYQMAHWWERIDDALLSEYVSLLLEENLSLIQANERLVQATAVVRSARADYYPTLGIDGNRNRSFAPGVNNSNIPFDVRSDRNFATTYGANATTSWQLDLFGRIGRSVESAIANAEATAFDKEALKQSLIAQLVRQRVAVATNARLVRWAEDNTRNRETSYGLVKRRYDLGAQNSNLADVFLAEENLSTVRSDIHEFMRLLSAESYNLDVLLGQMPGTTDAYNSQFPLLPPPRDVPVCLPASLLDRRPDLRAAELRVAAATADIGVAIADLYPNISITGSLGFAGNTTNDLFSARQLTGSLIGAITTRIFEGGRLRANIRIQESEARELAAAYAETILNAVREVETALQAERALAEEATELERSVEAFRKNAIKTASKPCAITSKRSSVATPLNKHGFVPSKPCGMPASICTSHLAGTGLTKNLRRPPSVIQ